MVIGGAALSVIGIGIRSTRDVDVLGLCETSSRPPRVVKHKPLPPALLRAAEAVANALGLSSDWLNAGPADLLDAGLPAGFESRLTRRGFGQNLAVWVPSREDLICFKTYAAADTGIGRHTEDLQALRPSCEELLAGALWARSQDPSESFCKMLTGLLRYFGCEEAAQELGRE